MILLPALTLGILVSCKKEEEVQPQTPVTESVAVSSTHNVLDSTPALISIPYDTAWRLSMQVPSKNVDFDVRVSGGGILVNGNDQPVGNVLKFFSGTNDVMLSVLYDGTITFFIGDIDGHSFIMIDGMLNICSGPQQVPFTYRLYKQGS